MTGYTKGPWKTEDLSEVKKASPEWIQPAFANGGWLVYAEDCESHPVADCSCNHTCRDADECAANARLIAAAPDLLETLKDLLEVMPPIRVTDKLALEAFAHAEAAIAKAEGGER
jgi:hypothetical protein